MNLSGLQPRVSACESFFNTHWCPDAAVSTPLQHVTHHTLSLNILHTHTHTHGDNGRGVDRVNPDSPIITILPVSSCSHSEREREREREREGGVKGRGRESDHWPASPFVCEFMCSSDSCLAVSLVSVRAC